MSPIHNPDYVGVVSGAQYKVEDGEEGIAEYALMLITDGRGRLYAMSELDLRYLKRQIEGLIDE
ncbi:hypothetical protein A5747_13560 [Mycobacterium sp. IS-836]|uniref:hypothetical protein n=1 Tax=Mycobacterium sp. IS-836 TaxID=1834160 RepID=UPI00096DD094|nr:hypothetical protein [Mycobacterium sp. IS-836]OMC55413.1 hypothetical protein A5747_13560 [Mycobacterium sp. IS-836]